MSVEMLTNFRRVCRENGIQLEVVKNTLIQRASDNTASRIGPHLEGPTALMTTDGPIVAPARVLENFIQENKFPKIKAACLEGTSTTRPGFRLLAKLPSREVCSPSC